MPGLIMMEPHLGNSRAASEAVDFFGRVEVVVLLVVVVVVGEEGQRQVITVGFLVFLRQESIT